MVFDKSALLHCFQGAVLAVLGTDFRHLPRGFPYHQCGCNLEEERHRRYWLYGGVSAQEFEAFLHWGFDGSFLVGHSNHSHCHWLWRCTVEHKRWACLHHR